MSTGFQDIRTNDPGMLTGSSFRVERETGIAPASPLARRPVGQVVAAPSGRISPLRGADAPLRIRLFNVKYSPNLGDGLLSECLEKALIALGASGDTWSIDLSLIHI